MSSTGQQRREGPGQRPRVTRHGRHGEPPMLKNAKLQMLLVLGGGVLLGYCVAAGKFPSLSTAAGPPADGKAACPASGDGEGCCGGGEGSLLTAARAAREESEEAIAFELIVPESAGVLIEDQKTTSKGAVRHFETPPLAVGKRYAYKVTVEYNGTKVKRTIYLAHGKDNSFDFRPDKVAVGKTKPARAKLQAKPSESKP